MEIMSSCWKMPGIWHSFPEAWTAARPYPNLWELTEESILERLKRRVAIPRGSGVLAGIGDDCAIFRPPGANEDLLFTTDLLIEGVHFERATLAPGYVGLYLIELQLPALVNAGPAEFYISADGQESNRVRVHLEP